MRGVVAGATVMAGLMALPVASVSVIGSLGAPGPAGTPTGAPTAPTGTPAGTTPAGDTRLAWADAFAARLGASSTPAIRFVLAWATEVGASAENNNPLDSTWPEPGSTLLPGEGDSVRMYPDLATGLTAGVATITDADPASGYQPVIDALRRSDLAGAAAALQHSRWCVDPRGPDGHECAGYGSDILRIAASYADLSAYQQAGRVRAGTTDIAGSTPHPPAGDPEDAAAPPPAPTGPAATAVPPPTTATAPAPPAPVDVLFAWLSLQLGKPYIWGGTGPAGYDCSGLTLMALARIGVPLPRTAAQQYAATVTTAVARADAQPGDLLFWAYRPTDPATIHHVAIYVGAGRMVEAATEGVPVHEVPVWDDGGLLPEATRPVALRSTGA